MMSMYEQARSIALIQLGGGAVTREEIEETVGRVVPFLEARGKGADEDIDSERLVRELESMCNVWVPNSTALDGEEDHRPWLERRADEIQWNFWERYERWLRERGMAPASVARLDDITNQILSRFEDPDRSGAWDRRGLVVGQVQSGKTANYTGLICKGIDAGYRLIIVLAGLHNSLRSQTQLRIDEGVLGFDTRARRTFSRDNQRVGVGAIPGEFLHANSFTSSDERGDFNLRVAQNIGVMVGGQDPVILVVKKNKSILNNLTKWATGIRQEVHPETGRPIVRDVPLLVIDDEADNASVDTKDYGGAVEIGKSDEYNPSVINGLIRKLLNSFEESVYLGYTATPFANIFIDEQAATPEYGPDLFPSSFIINLPAPSTYVGPTRVFGLRGDVAKNIEEVEPLPIVRSISDYDEWLPDRHKSHHIPGEIPQSLRKAVGAFLLAGAVKAVRGLGDHHHSMLVHVTRFTAVQGRVAAGLEELMEDMKLRLRYGDGAQSPTILEELAELYSADFVPTFDDIHRHGDLRDQFGDVPSWEDIASVLPEVAEKVEVKTINGTAADILDYRDHSEGLSVIAVGGDKLSRGLTLEGLSVSYYLRASRMYDTLMQMGRWFGYRPGYLDVCRLYTTDELQRWYAAVTGANEELLREFDYMAAVHKTPRDFGLRVKQHPDGLLVTARTKLRNARQLSITFAGSVSETIFFKTSAETLQRNEQAVQRLVKEAGNVGTLKPRGDSGTGNVQWDRVPPHPVLNFLRDYEGHPDAAKAVTKTLRDYVEDRNRDGELVEWTVLVVSNQQAPSDQRVTLGEFDIGLATRSQYPEFEGGRGRRQGERYSIRRLVSPVDESADLDDDARARAVAAAVKAWQVSARADKADTPPKIPSGIAARNERPPTRGLLLIYPLNHKAPGVDVEAPVFGFAMSFPASTRAKPVAYQVNNVYWEQEFESYVEDV